MYCYNNCMIVTLTGDNSFGLKNELDRLTEDFVKNHGELALERLDGQEADFKRVNEALTSLPFLSDKKLIILREASTNKEFAEKFEQIFNNLPDNTDLILVEPKLDKRTAYYKSLKAKTDFREFKQLDTGGLAQWLVKAAKEQGGSLSTGDARYLVERLGTDQRMLSNELEKLLIYDSNISRSNIDLLTVASPQSTIFQLLEAAFAGRAEKTLELYAEQRALKVEPQQIIAMLAWQLHVLSLVKTAGERSADDIAKEAKLNPFVVRKSQGIARNLSTGQLKKLISNLLNIDKKSKTTAIDLDEALQHYLLTLTN